MLNRIQELKEKNNVVILAHYYQEPEIQDIADFVGDSLELSRKAATTDADVVLLLVLTCFICVRCLSFCNLNSDKFSGDIRRNSG